ncbi:hypothetical protein K6119_14735 [Paracrocinitomix mangrovi]|uniref:hypothetical protein n=1 Tax=Paracrocinitomix mangrovi TaxID=2862509 RepID=UPI001C8D2A87|nr:hypothetical protein [Paracrocinitomix mangrovi]UKN00989.1 hypothetical protein K6119_14735 [Paracrocinitomix mangrovi]
MTDKKENKKEKWFKVDKVWFLDKGIELTIFILGFLIAMYIDDVRDSRSVKQLKEHHMAIVKKDLDHDLINYQRAYEHDSLRAEGCDYILQFLIKRQNSEFHSYGTLRHNTAGRIGPGFDFDEGGEFKSGDTIQIVAEKKGWFLDTSGFWINRQIVSSVDNQFNWFSQEIGDSVKKKIEFYAFYVDETKSVFQHKTGYDGLISQNTSAFLSTTQIESELSDYYYFGNYLNWLENYYRDSHYPKFNELRYSFGKIDLFQFLYLLNNEQNNELIQQLTLASIHAKKEKRYYLGAMDKNRGIQKLIKSKDF